MFRMLLLVLLLLPSSAIAADFHATRFDDPVPNGCMPTDCSLREAVRAAQAAAGADRVVLPAGDYALRFDSELDVDQTGPLTITTQLEIVGAGRGATTLTGPDSLPYLISVALNAGATSLTLSDFTIANHSTSLITPFAPVVVDVNGTLAVRRFGMRNNTGDNPGIVCHGALTIEDSVFEANTATAGNGALIYAAEALAITDSQFIDNTGVVATLLLTRPDTGTIDLRRNLFRGNVATEDGGAVRVSATAGAVEVDVSDSVFEDNRAGGSGGAVWVGFSDNALNSTRVAVIADGTRFSGNGAGGSCGAMVVETDPDLIDPPTLTMDLARFDGNEADGAGGALCAGADATITRSTFTGNHADSHAGAIFGGRTLRIERSTLSGNSAGASAGALFALGALTLEHSTVSGNTAATTAGGLLLAGASAHGILRSTLAGNIANGAPNALRFTSTPQQPGTLQLRSTILQGGCDLTDPGAVLPNSYNIESPGNTCALTTGFTFNQRNVSAAALALGALADNGGPTLTRMPGDASVARDPGVSSGAPCERIDQRGYASTDTRCDVGAVEVAGIPPEPLPVDLFADGFE